MPGFACKMNSTASKLWPAKPWNKLFQASALNGTGRKNALPEAKQRMAALRVHSAININAAKLHQLRPGSPIASNRTPLGCSPGAYLSRPVAAARQLGSFIAGWWRPPQCLTGGPLRAAPHLVLPLGAMLRGCPSLPPRPPDTRLAYCPM